MDEALGAFGNLAHNQDDSKITAFSDEEVESTYGKENMRLVYQAAKAHLENMNGYFSKYPAKKLNVDAKLGDKEIAATLSRVC